MLGTLPRHPGLALLRMTAVAYVICKNAGQHSKNCVDDNQAQFRMHAIRIHHANFNLCLLVHGCGPDVHVFATGAYMGATCGNVIHEPKGTA